MAAEQEEFIGAVGFVDVSGFTKLSEKLAKEHGRKGAELLNVYVNAYFAQLIEGINKYAGDVIKFAGDALQVVWRNRANGPTAGEPSQPASRPRRETVLHRLLAAGLGKSRQV